MTVKEEVKYSPSIHLEGVRKTKKIQSRIVGNQVTPDTEYLLNTGLEC
jgi:hypothetical protein